MEGICEHRTGKGNPGQCRDGVRAPEIAFDGQNLRAWFCLYANRLAQGCKCSRVLIHRDDPALGPEQVCESTGE